MSEQKTTDTEFAVIGGGVVGMSVACGLIRRGKKVTVLDEGDVALRASRGNFGLVWVQSKGWNLPAYARWSRLSANLWPDFAAGLADETGVDIEHVRKGGLMLAMNDEVLDRDTRMLETLKSALDGDYPYERLGHNAVKQLEPAIGPKVAGGTYFPEDGHINPLHLYRALNAVVARSGAGLLNGQPVDAIEPEANGFVIKTSAYHVRAEKVVLCAGLGNARLAPMVGLEAPVRPQRGQVMITERLPQFLNYPTPVVRQVANGTVQIGVTHEEVDLDDRTTLEGSVGIAAEAIAAYPALADARMVRTWAALRILSPDGCPIYDQSQTFPGASLVNCHSGITLAAVHANVLAGWIAGDKTPEHVGALSARRFDVQETG